MQQIIVLGSPRSGSSLITRLLDLIGADLGTDIAEVGQLDDRERGFWEHRGVVETNEALLHAKECDWNQLASWEMVEKAPKRAPKKLADTYQAIKDICADAPSKAPWVIKDPRMCLTLPYWLPKLTKPIAVVVARHPLEVAISMQTRYGTSLAEGLALWEFYACSTLNAARDLPTIHCNHHDIVHKAKETLCKVSNELKEKHDVVLKEADDKELQSFIKPELHLSKAEKDSDAEQLSAFQLTLFDYLTGKKKAPSTPLEPSQIAKDTLEHAAKSLELETTLVEKNKSFATAEQARYALDTELTVMKAKIEELKQMRMLEKKALEKEKEDWLQQQQNAGLFSRFFGSKKAA